MKFIGLILIKSYLLLAGCATDPNCCHLRPTQNDFIVNIKAPQPQAIPI